MDTTTIALIVVCFVASSCLIMGFVVLGLLMSSQGGNTADSIDLSTTQQFGVGSAASADQVERVVRFAATSKDVNKVSDRINKQDRITSINVPDFNVAFNKLSKDNQTAACGVFTKLPPTTPGNKAFGLAGILACQRLASDATPSVPDKPPKTSWHHTVNGNLISSYTCVEGKTKTCTAPITYRPYKRLNVVGTVVKTRPNVKALDCVWECDYNNKCDFFEMHGSTCVLKRAEIPTQCEPEDLNKPKVKCADGLSDNVTLYAKDNDPRLPAAGWMKQLETLTAYSKLGECKKWCLASFILTMIGGLFTMAAPVGGVLGATFTAVDIAIGAASIGTGVKASKLERKRMKVIQDGGVFMNIPPEWAKVLG